MKNTSTLITKLKLLLIYFHNFFFCLRYPFYRMYRIIDGYQRGFLGYLHTDYDLIPTGWQIAFGKELSEDLKKAIKEERRRVKKETGRRPSVLDIFYFTDIRDKNGRLCLYARTTPKIRSILSKYMDLSSHYCFKCGRPVEYKTDNNVRLCEFCFLENMKNTVFNSPEEAMIYLDTHLIRHKEKKDL